MQTKRFKGFTLAFLMAAALAQSAMGHQAATSSSAAASGNVSSSPSSSATTNALFDRLFIFKAAEDSLLEITLGQLAQTNSTNSAVQQFGARLVADHTNTLAQAQPLATNLGVTLPTTLNAEAQQLVQNLAALTGADFDKAFLEASIASHKKDIGLFEKAALRGRNAEVRAFARNNIPVLATHLAITLELYETYRANAGCDVFDVLEIE
ncbi:MAG: outer membrane protein [Verrucomicrobiales bacterium]|nr:outer membrane protein [Verrucomicrobiales bacterium]